MAEDNPVESQQILKEQMKPTFKRLSITEVTETRLNTLVLCLPLTHQETRENIHYSFCVRQGKRS